MRQAVVLGKPDTKRTHYLGRAAREAGLHVLFLDWDRWREDFPEGETFLKIDPPVWDNCSLERLGDLVGGYEGQLREIQKLARFRDVEFLNEPGAIMALLDKQVCKETLVKAGLAVSEEVRSDDSNSVSEKGRSAKAAAGASGAGQPEGGVSGAGWPEGGASGVGQPEGRERDDERKRQSGTERIDNVDQLLEVMRVRRAYQVFIKPVYGSGAAGVAAFRWQPLTGKMVLYTCARERSDEEGDGLGEGLVNTKQLQRITDSRRVLSMAGKLLRLGCIVERWYAKAEYQGFSYDLRAVVQDGRMDFCLARLSKGPITNLHLNNHPLELGMLGLPGKTLDELEGLCRNAVGCFPGLRSAGIDILLERGSLRPRIIEMNAQGDLIYQDIYGENVIYRRQAELMRQACGKKAERADATGVRQESRKS